VRRNVIRLSRVAPVVAVAAASVLGVSPAASAAPAVPAGPSHGQAAITVLYDSTELAVSTLQKAPDKARVLAAAVILAAAKVLITGPDPSSPGIEVGGLDLDAYCQGIGDASAITPYPGQEVTGGAYTWVCVSASGAQTPVNLQAACNAQYPGQVTLAYPQDPNNSYSWICLAPVSGSYTDAATHTTVDSVTTPTGDATLITSPGNSYLAVDDNGDSATVVQTTGSGYMSYDGGSGGGVSVLAYDGGNGGGVAI